VCLPLLKTPKTPKTPLKEFLSAINPIDTDGWRDMRWYARCYEIFKVRLNTIAEINFGKPFNKNILLLNFPENKSMHLSLIRVPSVHITTSVFC
jgi:hypothetical protein